MHCGLGERMDRFCCNLGPRAVVPYFPEVTYINSLRLRGLQLLRILAATSTGSHNSDVLWQDTISTVAAKPLLSGSQCM